MANLPHDPPMVVIPERVRTGNALKGVARRGMNCNYMWPFSFNKKPTPIPTIIAGEISVHWNKDCNGWEFSDGEYDYSLADNTDFDIAVLDNLRDAKQWLFELDQEIDKEIKKHLQGWCDWNGDKNVVYIDVSRLISNREIDVSYAGGEEWGDFGVNIVITDGKITNSYAGD